MLYCPISRKQSHISPHRSYRFSIHVLEDTVLTIHWFAYINLLILRTACVDYSVFNSTMLARMFSAGVLVVRGKDWQYGDQGSGSIGNITQGLGMYSVPGYIQVLWADGHRNSYRAGNSGKYDVCRVVGKKMLLYEIYGMQYNNFGSLMVKSTP